MKPVVVLCCGAGGVGKTTTSAALALGWAMQGLRVVVMTIDPARRLADSLGLANVGSETVSVPLPPEASGQLDALMLDAAASWDALITQVAPDPQRAARVLTHRYYRITRARLGGSHEFMAHDMLLQLWQSGRYDVVVVDTPPASHALEFLRAPGRLSALLDLGLLRVLRMPARAPGWSMLERVSEGLGQVLRRLAGRTTVEDIADFVGALGPLSARLLERTRRAQTLLRDPATRSLLVTTPTPAAWREALDFAQQLREREMSIDGLIVNRVRSAPHYPTVPPLPDDRSLPAELRAMVQQTLEHAHARQQRAAREDERSIDRLAEAAPTVTRWRVPMLPTAPCDLTTLAELGPHLPDARWLVDRSAATTPGRPAAP